MSLRDWRVMVVPCFSALQRAENSSTCRLRRRRSRVGVAFQCSSASRKFLNLTSAAPLLPTSTRFSALQRAENSSTQPQPAKRGNDPHVSVLFSEPKIPQLYDPVKSFQYLLHVSVLFSEPKIPQQAQQMQKPSFLSVSVLFSEPKIPQRGFPRAMSECCRRFSALQRAENSSTLYHKRHGPLLHSFSALQRAENSSTRWTKCKTVTDG